MEQIYCLSWNGCTVWGVRVLSLRRPLLRYPNSLLEARRLHARRCGWDGGTLTRTECWAPVLGTASGALRQGLDVIAYVCAHA